jgi:hypothetical protein
MTCAKALEMMGIYGSVFDRPGIKSYAEWRREYMEFLDIKRL